MQTDQLLRHVESIAQSSTDAMSWVADNPDIVGADGPMLNRQLYKHRRTAERLVRAVKRPMCVGVFGPSQAGKSYLISALARKDTNPLVASFDGVPGGIDFVRTINPEGGEESTGQVTRFTISRPSTPAGYPVAIRLLSLTDIVKILGNTYHSDVDLSNEPDLDQDALVQALQEAAERRSETTTRFLADDAYDLQEYFEKNFRGQPRIRALSHGYWAGLAEHGPKLGASSLASLLSWLWGGLEPFTRFLIRIIEALDTIGHH